MRCIRYALRREKEWISIEYERSEPWNTVRIRLTTIMINVLPRADVGIGPYGRSEIPNVKGTSDNESNLPN